MAHPVLDRWARGRQAADRWGFTCLDAVWQGPDAIYRFQCRQGHVFSKTYYGLVSARHGECPECVRCRQAEAWTAHLRQSGVTCVDSEWRGARAIYHFTCAKGHAWQRKGGKALAKADCPHCGRAGKYARMRLADGLERLQAVAARHGGVCLSDRFVTVNHPYQFRCAKGHTWQANGGDVLRRTWCDLCARERKSREYLDKNGLARIQAKARERGGRCLDTVYHGSSKRYRFTCRLGHTWEATGARVLRGAWCLLCAHDGKRLSLDDAQQAAVAHGGECLSDSYVNTMGMMRWRCARGHTWKATFGTIRRGHWCATCGHLDNRKLSLDDAQRAAANRGGSCLSDEYLSCTKKLHWRCHRGHTWRATFSTIRAGHWCPECAHMAKITNPRSKARKRYAVAGVDTAPAPEWPRTGLPERQAGQGE